MEEQGVDVCKSQVIVCPSRFLPAMHQRHSHEKGKEAVHCQWRKEAGNIAFKVGTD